MPRQAPVDCILEHTGVARSVVKYGGQGQSGQAIKLFQITPYVNDFQTLKQLQGKFMAL